MLSGWKNLTRYNAKLRRNDTHTHLHLPIYVGSFLLHRKLPPARKQGVLVNVAEVLQPVPDAARDFRGALVPSPQHFAVYTKAVAQIALGPPDCIKSIVQLVGGHPAAPISTGTARPVIALTGSGPQ